MPGLWLKIKIKWNSHEKEVGIGGDDIRLVIGDSYKRKTFKSVMEGWVPLAGLGHSDKIVRSARQIKPKFVSKLLYIRDDFGSIFYFLFLRGAVDFSCV